MTPEEIKAENDLREEKRQVERESLLAQIQEVEVPQALKDILVSLVEKSFQ